MSLYLTSNQNLITMKTSINLPSFLKLSLLALAFVFVSCEKESLSENITTANANAKASAAAQQGDQTIAEIVVSYSEAEEPQFTLLLAALEYTGLTSTFAGGDNYTVFAPTDDAFLELLGGDASNLYTLSPEAVTNILLYHVTDGRRFSNSVLGKNNWKKIDMLNEGTVYVNSGGGIDTNDEDMQINASILVEDELFDIAATNGVIHVIDAVLVPTE